MLFITNKQCDKLKCGNLCQPELENKFTKRPNKSSILIILN